jgi:predicted amino acid dehydrogenase
VVRVKDILKHRKIVTLNLLNEGGVTERFTEYRGVRFSIREHLIGCDFEVAENLIRSMDGYVDGFALSGVTRQIGICKDRVAHPGFLRLLRAATRTPVYVADDVRDLFSDWTLSRLLKQEPQLFLNKKVLFVSALASPLTNRIVDAGATISSADPMVILGLPQILKGEFAIQAFYRALKPIARRAIFSWMKRSMGHYGAKAGAAFSHAAAQNDIVVGFGSLLARMPSFEGFKGKILLVDSLNEETRRRVELEHPAQIIEFIPRQAAQGPLSFQHFSELAAVVDQLRVLDDSSMSLDEYLLKWLETSGVTPNEIPVARGIKRRCAFIIHPLHVGQLWNTPGLGRLRGSPKRVQRWLESGASRLPGFHYGSIQGVVSQSTGQEAECDLYAIPSTPREILAMDVEKLYDKLVRVCEMAEKRGASLIGLGAYTKVVGDAGVSVAKRSPIPVTNGNSYSASTTLWAARDMVERMGLIPPERVGNRFRAKAMIIGATGSIGRVSALLTSLVFEEVVLVANRVDKLLELREEVLKLSPTIRVSVSTRADREISDMDLIVTATSNQSGKLLDIDLVKPGAVICDCSRPLDIPAEDARRRPDVLVIESGEVLLPGDIQIRGDIGLPKPSVYACTAETVLLALEGRFESFSLSKQLSMEKTKEIYKLGLKHGAKLSAIQGPLGFVTDESIARCRELALKRLPTWNLGSPLPSSGLTTSRFAPRKLEVVS